jgi:hypothetical protein
MPVRVGLRDQSCKLPRMTAGGTQAPFDPEPVRRGIDSLRRSFAQWVLFLNAHPSKPLPNDEVVKELRGQANVHVVEVVRWIRSVDDYLAGRGTGAEAMPGYTAARKTDPEIEALLDGVRYAANKSLHLLVDLAAAPPPVDLIGESFLVVGSPPPERPRRDIQVYRWPNLGLLPQRARDQQLREAYEAQLAGRFVDTALAHAVGWLVEQQP